MAEREKEEERGGEVRHRGGRREGGRERERERDVRNGKVQKLADVALRCRRVYLVRRYQ